VPWRVDAALGGAGLGSVFQAVSGNGNGVQAGHPLKISVAGHDRQVAFKGGCGNQGIDVPDEARAVRRPQLPTDDPVAVKNRVGQRVRIDAIEQVAQRVVEGWEGRATAEPLDDVRLRPAHSLPPRFERATGQTG
jgi:hypothetical protein